MDNAVENPVLSDSSLLTLPAPGHLNSRTLSTKGYRADIAPLPSCNARRLSLARMPPIVLDPAAATLDGIHRELFHPSICSTQKDK